MASFITQFLYSLHQREAIKHALIVREQKEIKAKNKGRKWKCANFTWET